MVLFYILLISGETVKVEERTNHQGVTVTFTISDFEQKEQFGDGMQFVELSMPGAGIMYEIGKPNLPVLREFVEVPWDAELSIEAKVLKEREVKLSYPVYPKQAPVPKIAGYKQEFTIDKAYYTIDEFLPKVRARIIEIGEIRGHRVAVIEVYPVQYNPSQNIVSFANEIRVTIRFQGADWGTTITKLERYYSPYYENRLKAIVNYRFFAEFTPTVMSGLRMTDRVKGHPLPIGELIITPDSWYNSVLPLAEWKRQKGYYVTVAKLSQTGSSTTEILNYIKDAYNNWPVPPTFVLLVGDVDSIGYWTGGGSSNPPTDLNYSLMNVGDYFPDIDLSRFSIANQVQLDSIVDKTIRYEKNDWTQGTDWCKKSYFVASADASNHGIAEGTHQYCMAICREQGMTVDSLWTYYGSGTPPSAAINDGRAWVMYSGHGSTGGWSDPGIIWGVSDVHSLSNTDKPVLVGTFACLSGDYTQGECFSESWIRVGRKGGLVNFASSVSSYWDEDDILQRRMFDSAFDSGLTWVMGMLNKGKLLLYAHYGDTPNTQRYFEMYNMMGDGSVDIYSDIPYTITVNYSDAIPLGPFSLNIAVQDAGNPVQGALVCAKRDTIFANYTNSSGIATLNVMNTNPCTLLITVTGHNLKPFFGICRVISEGPYVAYFRHSIDDDSTGASAGNGDGIVDAGEIIELLLQVKNYGSLPACTVEGELSTTSPFITITDSISIFGTIASGDSAWSSSPYVFEVNLNTPDSRVATFNSTCKDSFDSTWGSNFNLLITHLIGVSLTSPNGGESLVGNSTYPVTWITNGVGFDSYRLLYSLSPDSEWDTSACSISSPHPYPNNYDTTWIISEGGKQKIKVHFINFDTETNYDFVYLLDKNNNQIASYNGSLGDFWSQEVPGDTVKVRFVSDFSNTYYGFDVDKYAVFQEATWLPIADNINPDSSSWNWVVPNVSCTTAKVKVQVMNYLDEVVAEDESDGYFTIIGVAVEEGVSFLPKIYKLSQVYPNPSIQTSVILLQIPVKSKVSLRIYDAGGRLVKILADEERKPGCYTEIWDHRDNVGKYLPNGIYFYKLECSSALETPNFKATKKLILIR